MACIHILNMGEKGVDATFFSLHKMLPFENGGALLLFRDELKRLALSKEKHDYSDMYDYDFGEIVRKRTDNYLILDKMIRDEKYNDVFCTIKGRNSNKIGSAADISCFD